MDCLYGLLRQGLPRNDANKGLDCFGFILKPHKEEVKGKLLHCVRKDDRFLS